MKAKIMNFIENHVGEIMMITGVLLAIVGVMIDLSNFNECRAHSFSLLFCLTAI